MLYFSKPDAHGEREKKPQLHCGLRTDGFMVGSFSDRARIVNDVSAFPKISVISWNLLFRGRRNIWRCWRVTLVALRDVNGGSALCQLFF